jgi:uncharacterized surface protein with fasciclin (FAS1) repeats|tara:strand:+ start:1494 stop:3197 length:1704 start_codon:yes stop_codon:yes gene_type:complete
MTTINVKSTNIFRLALYSVCSIFLAGEVHAANPAETKTVGRVIRERSDLSKFRQVFEEAELGLGLTSTSKSRTVFIPLDSAFAKLPEQSQKKLFDPRNKDRLKEIYGFHVLDRTIPVFALGYYNTLRTINGQYLSVNYKKGTVGDARFTGERIECSNGAIYLIDSVLKPNTDDLFQRLQKDGRFKIFTKAIIASRQGKRFQNTHGLYTAFAPTDEAFGKLPPEFVESLFLPENDEKLEDIIRHHIIENVRAVGKIPGISSLGVSDVTPISSFGQQINFKQTKNGPTVDGVKIVSADIPCANGLIHVIDTVMAPVESNLLDLLRDDERFSTLVSLLEKTGLSFPVDSRSIYTIFAPVNEAFTKEPYASLITNMNEQNREALYAILTRHVISGKHVTENCKPYNKLRTIVDSPIILKRSGSESTINGVPIIETDIEAYNGLISVVGSVIEDSMDLPEGDISTVDAMEFVQETLTKAAVLYKDGKYEDCWRYYSARGYEFFTKYNQLSDRNSFNGLKESIKDDQPLFKFASEAWKSRNAFRNVLRSLEQRKVVIRDRYLMQQLEKARFGR